MVSLSFLIDGAHALALDAGREILPFYRREDLAVSVKADRSPLTEADLASDRLITAGLKKLTPDIPCISEETGIPDYETRRRWRRFWLVDPLDGTKEFLKHAGDFTVNIALVEDGAPVLGVVFAPALDSLYFAAADAGSWRIQAGGRPERIRARPGPAEDGWTVVESRSHPSDELERFLSGLRVKSRLKIGSSLKFCRLAEGAADLYPRFGPTSEWDTAAGDCIYRFAGEGAPLPSPLIYNKPTLRNGDFVMGMDLPCGPRS